MAGAVSPFVKQDIARTIDTFRERRPHVHCITNAVAQAFTANVVLAAGGTVSTTIAQDEIVDFVRFADALIINLGTMDDQRQRSIEAAVEEASKINVPWLLDPVFVQASPIRHQLAGELLKWRPNAVRCNQAEGAALFGTSQPKDWLSGSIALAVTGKVDTVLAGNRVTLVHGGSPLMDRVTAMGCALSALLAGYLAIAENSEMALIAGLAHYASAGRVAEKKAEGPGTFEPYFLDALAAVDASEAAMLVEISE